MSTLSLEDAQNSYNKVANSLELPPNTPVKGKEVSWKTVVRVILIPEIKEFVAAKVANDVWDFAYSKGVPAGEDVLTIKKVAKEAMESNTKIADLRFSDVMETPWPRHRDHRPHARHLKDKIYTN